MKKFSMIHKDAAVRKNSSSGGAFTCITDCVFERYDNVAVWGCVLNEDNEAVHVRATDRRGRDAMCGSKYISSDPGNTFSGVRRDLETGCFVVFSGTPCQVAGLLSFLQVTGTNTEHLLTVDFVCHGVASNAFFADYLQHMEQKYKGKVVACRFRAHAQPGKKQDMELIFANGKKYNAPSTHHDWFYSVYLNNLILRPSCYACKFASMQGSSDITIADDWSVRDRDASLVFLRTPEALALLPYLQDAMEVREYETHQDIPNLGHSTPRPPRYEAFWNTYRNGGYLAAQTFVGNNTFKGELKYCAAKWADKLHIRDWVKKR